MNYKKLSLFLIAVRFIQAEQPNIIVADSKPKAEASMHTIIQAANNNDYPTIQKLLSKGDIQKSKLNTCNSFSLITSDCPLFIAAAVNNNYPLTLLLLEHSADPNVKDKDNRETILFHLKDNQVDVATLLIKHGADVNAQNRAGYTPIYNAVNQGYEHLINRLIEHGADINHKLKDGTSTLNDAIMAQKKDIVKLLLDHGAQFYGAPSFKIGPGKTGAIKFARKANTSKELRDIIRTHYKG